MSVGPHVHIPTVGLSERQLQGGQCVCVCVQREGIVQCVWVLLTHSCVCVYVCLGVSGEAVLLEPAHWFSAAACRCMCV